MGPFAAALMQSIGVRRSVYLAMGLVALSVAASTLMTAAWQLMLLWGLFVGLGVGVVAMVLGATIVNRWFATNRGLAMGLLAASTATGQLVFLPPLAALVTSIGWQAATILIALAAAALIPITALLLPEKEVLPLLDFTLEDALPDGVSTVDYELGTPHYTVQAYDTAAGVAEVRADAPIIKR